MKTSLSVILALFGAASAQYGYPGEKPIISENTKAQQMIQDFVDSAEKVGKDVQKYEISRQAVRQANMKNLRGAIINWSQHQEQINARYEKAIVDAYNNLGWKQTGPGQAIFGVENAQAIIDYTKDTMRQDQANFDAGVQTIKDQFEFEKEQSRQFVMEFSDEGEALNNQLEAIVRELNHPSSAANGLVSLAEQTQQEKRVVEATKKYFEELEKCQKEAEQWVQEKKNDPKLRAMVNDFKSTVNKTGEAMEQYQINEQAVVDANNRNIAASFQKWKSIDDQVWTQWDKVFRDVQGNLTVTQTGPASLRYNLDKAEAIVNETMSVFQQDKSNMEFAHQKMQEQVAFSMDQNRKFRLEFQDEFADLDKKLMNIAEELARPIAASKATPLSLERDEDCDKEKEEDSDDDEDDRAQKIRKATKKYFKALQHINKKAAHWLKKEFTKGPENKKIQHMAQEFMGNVTKTAEAVQKYDMSRQAVRDANMRYLEGSFDQWNRVNNEVSQNYTQAVKMAFDNFELKQTGLGNGTVAINNFDSIYNFTMDTIKNDQNNTDFSEKVLQNEANFQANQSQQFMLNFNDEFQALDAELMNIVDEWQTAHSGPKHQAKVRKATESYFEDMRDLERKAKHWVEKEERVAEKELRKEERVAEKEWKKSGAEEKLEDYIKDLNATASNMTAGIQALEVIETPLKVTDLRHKDLSGEAVLAFITFGAMVVVAIYNLSKKLSGTNADQFRSNEIEFEADNEVLPVKESKTMIKKTLKNIMAKNQANATLIQ